MPELHRTESSGLEQRIQLILAQDSQKQIDWLSRERSSLIAELRASVKNGSELLAERTGLLTDKETLAGQNQELQVTNQNLRDTNRSLQDQNSKLRRNFWIALSGGVVAAVTSALLIFKDDIRSRFEEINPASSSEILPEKPDLTK